MGDADSRCQMCGGAVPHPRPAFCGFCGASLPSLTAAQPAAATPSVAQRLAAVEAHPSFTELLAHEPSASGVAMGMSVQLGFGVVFTAVALVITAGFALVSGPCCAFPLLFVALGIGIVVNAHKNRVRLAGAALLRFPAIVVDERTEVSGGGDSMARTRYYLTLERGEDGRSEHEVARDVAGMIAPGDAGVAYVKDRHLLDFRRVDV